MPCGSYLTIAIFTYKLRMSMRLRWHVKVPANSVSIVFMVQSCIPELHVTHLGGMAVPEGPFTLCAE